MDVSSGHPNEAGNKAAGTVASSSSDKSSSSDDSEDADNYDEKDNKDRSSKTPPVNDPEDKVHSSTASNSKTSMVVSSGHPNDAGKKAAGTDASSSSDESSSSDDSEDGAGSSPTQSRGKNLALQSRFGQGKQTRRVLPTSDDSSEDSSDNPKDDARSATTSA